MTQSTLIQQSAQLIQQADALLITAGAGMGIDSGLPDFRGQNGFWRAFPPLAHLGKRFVDMATPELFHDNPKLAWGFYGWRLNAYRNVVAHQGFHLLKQWADQKPHGAFVFTSNVDGQFQKAGFAEHRVLECHGSIHYLQCSQPCHHDIWSANEFVPQVNEQLCELENAPPICPKCQEIARPNILMFSDGQWLSHRTRQQEQQLEQWLYHAGNVVIIELGAGTAVPSVRLFSEHTARWLNAPLIRINPDEPQVIGNQNIALPMGALDALLAIEQAMK